MAAKRKPKVPAETLARLATVDLEHVDPRSLAPAEANPRRGDLAGIAQAIEELGFLSVVVAQRSTRRVVIGNHRWSAARAKGLATIPVLWLDADDQAALEAALDDNLTGDRAGFDVPKLLAVLTQLELDQLAGTGFAEGDVDALQAQLDAAAKWTPKELDPDALGGAVATVTCPSCGLAFPG